jgi:HEAT repeat protein
LNVLKQYGRYREDVKTLCALLLGDKSRQIKFSAVDFLGDVGNEAQLPELENLANKKSDPVSTAAEKAIKKIKERNSK